MFSQVGHPLLGVKENKPQLEKRDDSTASARGSSLCRVVTARKFKFQVSPSAGLLEITLYCLLAFILFLAL